MVKVITALGIVSTLLATQGAVAHAAPVMVSATVNAFGYPDWYEDNPGVRLEPCLDTADTVHCVLNPAAGVFDPALPLAMPTNFPDELFYYLAQSDRLATPGCAGAVDPGAANPGRAQVTMALEGAFANGDPTLGDQQVFGRLRVRADGGLCPGQAYTFSHPYGEVTLNAEPDGSITHTVDMGCVPVAPQTCNFAQALTSPILTIGFLRWDPAVAPAADPGYLGGDAGTLHPVVGGVRTNVTITDATTAVIATTNLFTVAGKLAGPLLASTPSVDFGGKEAGATATATVTVTNVDAAPTTIGAITTTAAPFAVTGGTCTAAVLGRDQACTIELSFTPTAAGVVNGSLLVGHGAFRSPLTVALGGTGTGAGSAPAFTISVPSGTVPASMAFGSVRVGTQSPSQAVTVTNTGTAPLRVLGLAVVDAPGSSDSADRNAFRVVNDQCSSRFVPAGAGNTCTFGVVFAPTAAHASVATLRVTTDAASPVLEAALTGTGTGGAASVSTGADGKGPDGIDAATGFPSWYQDDNGVRLAECIDPADPYCIVLADPFYSGGAVSGAPAFSNFPEEYFYFFAHGEVATPGCAGTAPGRAFVRMAHEAAFGGADGAPINGDQIVFGRVRLRASGLCPDTDYTFTHPYGQAVVRTDAAGDIRSNAATTDIGCFPVAPETCDFSLSLRSPVTGGYLRQVNAPAGYLGDPAVDAPITGSTFVAPGEAAPANYFRISQGANVVAETNRFQVMGKLAGPLVATPETLDFGVVPTGSTSDARDVIFTNEGLAAVTVTSATISSLLGGAAEYAIADDRCSGRTLQPLRSSSDSCTVSVRFSPTANGTRAAQLNVAHSGLNNPFAVHLVGVGGAATGQAAISASPAATGFPPLQVGSVSGSQRIRISNLGGTAPLAITSVTLAGAGAASFNVDAAGCAAAVAPGASCDLSVRFAPVAAGDQQASVVIASNSSAFPTISVALDGFGSTANASQSAVLDAAGFRTWYQDANGVRVEPCYDPGSTQDPNCIVLPDVGYNPSNPLVFPSNFPEEFFYALTESEPVTIPAHSCGAAGNGLGGTAMLRLALEGAFTTGNVVAGQQTTFARIRIQATGLCPNTTYDFVHPYGTSQLTADGNGAVRSTVDAPNPVGDPQLTVGLLRWDPAAAPAAPAGYLGDGRSFHAIVGSQYRPGGPGTEPANEFSVGNASLPAVRTERFLVSGRLAGPVLADVASLTFAPQAVGTSSAAQTVRVSNVGATALTGFTPSITGADAGEFVIDPAGTCSAAATVAVDGSCTVVVRSRPTTAGPKTATLSVAHAGRRSPVTVALSGSGVAPAAAAITVTPTSVAFGNQNVGVASAPTTVTIANGGAAPLTVASATLGGANAGDFTRTTACAVVAPGANCTVAVTFQPTANGARSATLTITSDDPVRPTVTVQLSGTGVAPVLSLSATTLSLSTGANGSTTKSIDITNTGSAPLSLVGAPAITFGPQTVANPVQATTLKFSATHDCNNVAPGRKCRVNVTFVPGAGAANQTFTVQMSLLSNAINTPGLVTLTGLRK